MAAAGPDRPHRPQLLQEEAQSDLVMPGKVYVQTFGCQMNEYDSAKMADVLGDSHGLETTRDPAEADLLLLNTCSVREKAQEKVFSLLGRWRVLKQARWVVDGPKGAARILKLHPNTLRYRMKKHSIRRPD